jgi:hypothetical protein
MSFAMCSRRSLHRFFALVGAEADVKAVFVEWMRIPDLLMQLEDSLRASGVPLLKDPP